MRKLSPYGPMREVFQSSAQASRLQGKSLPHHSHFGRRNSFHQIFSLRHIAAILPLFLLFCGSCYGQTIQNGSFETLTPLQYGTYGKGTVPGWTLVGDGGLWFPLQGWQPTTPYFKALPDGQQVLWLNAASVTQDLGAPGAANNTYYLTVWVGNRAPVGLVPTNTYTIAMAVNGGVFCSTTGDNAQIPAGTFQKVVLPCPMGGVPTAGNLQVIISSAGSQVTFDNVSLTSAPIAPPPGPLTMISLNVKILLCTICDGTDDAPFNGQAVIAQTGGPVQTVDIPTGIISINSGWDFGQPDPLEFTFTLNAGGKQVGQVSQKIYKILFPSSGNIRGLIRIDSAKFILREMQEAFGQ